MKDIDDKKTGHSTGSPNSQMSLSTNGESRRDFIKKVALTAAGAAAVGGGITLPALAKDTTNTGGSSWVPNVKPGGKKVRIGVPLGYGPYNQPWRRGCWRIIKRIVELGGEPVTMRGTPSEKSEMKMERALLNRGIDALVMGIYATELQTSSIAKEAHKRGIATVGFSVNVMNSPAVMGDVYGTALKLGHYMEYVLQRQGTIVQTAETKGFFQPFDMEIDMVSLMVGWQPRMKELKRLPGATSTESEISISRDQVMSLLRSHPEKGSIDAIMSWWWPNTLGAAQALQRMKRTEIKLFNHYFSDQFLSQWGSGKIAIEGSTDTPWTTMGDNVAEIAVAMARGKDVPPRTLYIPPRFITTAAEAREWQATLKQWDKEATKVLKPYGG